MKKTLLTVCGVAVVIITIARQIASDPTLPINTNATPVFTWTDTAFDFGAIKKGSPVTHEFTFTNSGSAPLIITSVQASCGCTVTAFSKEPIEPGGSGFVTATFNAAKEGHFSKTITVNANTEVPAITLTIKGDVVPEAKL